MWNLDCSVWTRSRNLTAVAQWIEGMTPGQEIVS